VHGAEGGGGGGGDGGGGGGGCECLRETVLEGAERAVAEPNAFEALTTTRSLRPTSPGRTK
jgi:hypothetical protein